jgi:hypothetical protein
VLGCGLSLVVDAGFARGTIDGGNQRARCTSEKKQHKRRERADRGHSPWNVAGWIFRCRTLRVLNLHAVAVGALVVRSARVISPDS